MAYNAFTVTQDELASAAKWNFLGGNDEYFNTQVGAGFSSTSSTVWWEELGRTTLETAGDTITSPTLTPRKFLHCLVSITPTGTVDYRIRFNGDTGSNYSRRRSTNGSADSTATSGTAIEVTSVITRSFFSYFDVINIATNEKLVNVKRLNAATLRDEVAGKWANSSNQITTVSIVNTDTGSYDIGSELIVLGHD